MPIKVLLADDHEILLESLADSIGASGMIEVVNTATNGKEVLIVPGDKDVIADLATSVPLSLKKGKNVVRVAIMNGQGMVNFCARFLDEKGMPVKNFTTSVE